MDFAAMNLLAKGLAEAHIADLHREAARARDRAEARQAARDCSARWMPAVTLRLGTAADGRALRRLAALDSSEVPAAPVIVAEVGGELRAALSLIDRTVIADPFHPTAELVKRLVKRSEHLAVGRSNELSRLLEVLRPRASTTHRPPHAPRAHPVARNSLTDGGI